MTRHMHTIDCSQSCPADRTYHVSTRPCGHVQDDLQCTRFVNHEGEHVGFGLKVSEPVRWSS